MKRDYLNNCILRRREDGEIHYYLIMHDDWVLYRINGKELEAITEDESRRSGIAMLTKMLVFWLLPPLLANLDINIFRAVLLVADIVLSCLLIRDIRKHENYQREIILQKAESERITTEKISAILSHNIPFIIVNYLLTLLLIGITVKLIADCVLNRSFSWYKSIPVCIAFIQGFNLDTCPVNLYRLCSKLKHMQKGI